MICLRRKYFSANVTKLGYAIQNYPNSRIKPSRRRTAKNGSKIGKGKEEEGEEKESAERKNVGRRREGNADFCASFVVPSLLFPKFVLFALHGNGGKSVELWIELQVCRFISHFPKTVTLSAKSEGETSVRGKEKNWNKSRHSPPAYVSPSRSPFLSYPLSPTFAPSPPSFDGWV